MKRFLSIIIICIMPIRVVLPILCYTFDYDYIVKNLCDYRNNPKKNCRGRCYLEKELAKTNKTSSGSNKVEVAPLDMFFTPNIDFFTIKILQYSRKIDAEYRKIFYLSDFYSKIFRPPAGI